jgi:hypothetical protein
VVGMKVAVFLDMASCSQDMKRVSKEIITSIFRV